MTKREVAQLKGEVFGLQVLVMQSLCFIAAHTDDPVRHLQGIRDSAFQGIAAEPKVDVLPRYAQAFQEAAAGVVIQCVEAAQGVMAQDGMRAVRPDKTSSVT